jgi:hypothetical protein
MNDNPGYGFVPPPNSPKKELPEAPKANPPVVNNYLTFVSNELTMAIDLQAVLFVALMVVLVFGLIRLSSVGLRA